MRIDSDLTFSFAEPARERSESRTMSGTITGTGGHVDVRCDQLPKMSARTVAPLLRRTASALAKHGLTVSVSGPDGLLMTIGAVKGSLWHRVLTRSRHVQLERVTQFIRILRPHRTVSGGLTLAELMPPSTVLPLAPTFRVQPRRVTTTHDPAGGGRPRLLFSAGPATYEGQQIRSFYLRPGVTTIGSGPDCDLRLPGLDDLQAEIHRNESDEYVLVPRSSTVRTSVNGRPVTTGVLRTGSRIELGNQRMSYFRAEFADHGRPYGGRIGGELGYQRPQPTPTYRLPEH
jgi:hypothetical protein